ncbi:hypothetical protein EV368DRAFT_89374 [Lentinula lateritia]|nr:hypothetical protein EV368DRAFT_89374 [Lentinula lateritia]
MERAQERMRKLKGRRRAEKEARKRAEEEVARRAAEEREREEAAAWAASTRRKEEEAAEMRKVATVAVTSRNRTGPSPSEVSTSTRRVEVEIPHMINKGRGKQRAEVTNGDPDHKENEEKAPCERCRVKKIPCLEQAGKRSTVICKPCHDAKVRCLYSGRRVVVKREGGPSGERLAVLDSQMAQLLANNHLRESASRTQQYLRQLLRQQDEDHARLVAIETKQYLRQLLWQQDEDHARLVAIETRLAMADLDFDVLWFAPRRRRYRRVSLAASGFSLLYSQSPGTCGLPIGPWHGLPVYMILTRRRIVEQSDEDEENEEQEEIEKGKEGAEEEGEDKALAPKKAKTAASEKGKEREVE